MLFLNRIGIRSGFYSYCHTSIGFEWFPGLVGIDGDRDLNAYATFLFGYHFL